MALEHRDYYRDKKPDWDNISFSKKKPRFLAPLLFLFFFVLTVAFFHWRDPSRRFLYSPPVSVPVQSIPKDQIEQSVVSPVDKLRSLPNEIKQESLLRESPVVRSIPAGYSGYIEVNGVRKEIYSPAVVSETYRYKSVSNVKFLPVKINGIEFDAMVDTGASFVSVGPSVVRALGIRGYIEKKMIRTYIKTTWAYMFLCSVSLGSFEVSNIQCGYNPEATHDVLLGGSFLKNFNYSIDESSETITFTLR